MRRTKRSRWAVAVLGLAPLVMARIAFAQATPGNLARDMLNACRGRATCAEADFYSGTLAWSEELTSDIRGGGNRSTSALRVLVNMVVTAGKVQCTGSFLAERKQWSGGTLEMDSKSSGPIAGPGLIKMEFDRGGTHTVMNGTENEDVELGSDVPSYNLAVTCPSPTVTDVSAGETTVTRSEPARWGSSQERQTYSWPGSFTQSTLSGKSSYIHPDADPANGIQGTVTFTWSLTRSASPRP